MARRFASGISDGRSASFAGFIWYRRDVPYQPLYRQVQEVLRPAA
jgi:hypothetical protein